ncbi:MAG TPA: protein with DOMON-like ligand-binding domain protein, partial [Flavobacteriia bacterium]|nr:protein with DOMON-like ligand-binding domain protein [Flavobacteriia bacterium]
MIKKIFSVLYLLSASLVFSQEINSNRKVYTTKRIAKPPKIDANLSDAIWKELDVAKDFVEFRPEYGKKENPNKKTEVKLAYDDNGIYIAAYLYDDEPDKILRE